MKGNDTDSLLQEIEEYYEGFDPDYEACLWIGKNGAPYRIKDIVNDMEQAEAMIEKLYETLKTTMHYENENPLHTRRRKGRDKPLPKLSPHGGVQRIERTRNLLQHGSLI